MSALLQAILVLIHPFYVSVTKINHNEVSRHLEISCKIFTDDLEKALKKDSEQKPDLKNQASLDLNDKLIQEYLINKLKITIQQKNIELEYLGFENEEEATIIYFESKQIIPTPLEINVVNNFLTEIIPDQLNIVHYYQGNFHKTYQLSRKENTINWKLP
ncbi:MAG: hypothetical protein JNK69_13300 [Saprospiraceae bacterium]|nr:hypothetical protein [Candidatus Vicinibacter proximus]MBL7824378.1 hypothetical protein [Saprospiraceae bacterium]HRG31638.1 hypothetical protein [Saprospiraceae bacterium]